MEEVKQLTVHLKKEKIQGLALDIDETLSNTIVYWMDTLLVKFGNPEKLSPREMVHKYRYWQNVPYWQSEENFIWVEKFRRDSSVQSKTPLIEDSNHTVEKINKIIPIVAYVTARPENIREGTRYWLKRHGFPEASIIMAPEDGTIAGRGAWKASVLASLFPEVRGIIDDDLSFIHQFPKPYEGTVFLYNHGEFDDNRKNVIPCPTWNDVYLQVKKRFRND